MKLRILMLGACNYPVPQGSQVFLRDNALALAERGHEVQLVTYGYGVGRDRSGLKIHRCRRFPGDRKTAAGPSFAKPFLDLFLVGLLKRVFRQERMDIVYAHNYEALLVALLAGTRPIIYHAHNAMADELPYYFPIHALPQKIGSWLDHTFPRRAGAIVVPHRRLAGHLIVKGCDHTKVTIVPPPVNLKSFFPCTVETKIPPVLYTGNLDAYQNLGLLFAAMEIVQKRIPSVELIIATNEDADIPGATVMPIKGFDSLQQLLAKDHVMAMPRVSWSGYPVKLINGMAAGMAIVACESAAYPLTDGKNGIIVPDDDVEAFAAALVRLLLDHELRRRLGKQARKTIEDEHRPEDVAKKLEAIAIALLEAKRNAS
ncbi:MAG: glycosyltransferase family 4 protein [Candidatus Hydrogenedentes bacterium]|nr:glycosyltransferase family 4 protein [Candidatus Hydrogenedentota bacterium]